MKKKLILLCCLCSFNVLAEESFSEADFYDQMPVVLAANRIPQSYIDSASSITIISKEMIEAMGARNVPEILSIVPGFQSVYVYGNEPVSTYHGLGDRFQRRFQVLIDNRSVYTPFYGGVDWASLPLSIYDIEKIEVIRGPNSAVFGSNSFSAVISITTRDNYDYKPEAIMATGSQAWRNGYFRYVGGNEQISYSLSIENTADTGLQGLQDNQQSQLIHLRLDENLDSVNSLQFQFGEKLLRKDYGTTNPVLGANNFYQNLNPVRDIPVSSEYWQFAWENRASEKSLLRIQFYHNKQIKKDDYSVFMPATAVQYLTTVNSVSNPVNAPGVLSINQDVDTVRDDLELLYHYDYFNPVKLLFGMGLREESFTSKGFFATPEQQANKVAKLFSQVDWQASESLLFNFGFMYEDNKIAGIQNTPKLSIVYKMDNLSSLRLNYSMATRAPVLIEHNSDYRWYLDVPDSGIHLATGIISGNHQLKPEKITALELGYLKYFNVNHSVDFKFFQEELTDLVQEQTAALRIPEEQVFPSSEKPTSTFQNSGKATIKGLELQWDYQYNAGQHFYAQYTYLDIDNFDPDNGKNRIPQNSYALLWMMQLNQKHKVNVKWIHYDPFSFVKSLDSNPTNINNVDISYKYSLKLARQNASFNFGIKNLLGSNIEYQVKGTNDIAQTRQFLYAVFRANIF